MTFKQAMKKLRKAEDKHRCPDSLCIEVTFWTDKDSKPRIQYSAYSSRLSVHTRAATLSLAVDAMCIKLDPPSPQDVDNAVGSVNKEVTP